MKRLLAAVGAYIALRHRGGILSEPPAGAVYPLRHSIAIHQFSHHPTVADPTCELTLPIRRAALPFAMRLWRSGSGDATPRARPASARPRFPRLPAPIPVLRGGTVLQRLARAAS